VTVVRVNVSDHFLTQPTRFVLEKGQCW